MSTLSRNPVLLLAAASLLAGGPARANDSEAAVGIGGLTLKQSRDISLDYEDLFLSIDEVRITYRFTNHAKRPVDTLIAFPLPPLDANNWYRDWSALDFRTTVGGKPVTLSSVDVAMVNGRDVTALLRKRGWDMAEALDPESHRFFDGLSRPQVDAAVRDGLVRREGDSIMPLWIVQRHITRTQRFPAGKTITVTHRYKPMNGGSVGGALDPQIRAGKDGTAAHYRSTYCTDDAFLSGFDRRLVAAKRPDGSYAAYYSELWLDYVLKSGANWKGPIRDFRLVVDKGAPDNLVSFCMDGVRKISPTQFEVRKRNFEPKKDLSILIVQWHKALQDVE